MAGEVNLHFASMIEEADWIQLFTVDHQKKIKQLFCDLLHYRTSDIHKLLRDLDEVHKGKVVITKARGNEIPVQNFITIIIRLYCHCIENIKLARSVEKFLMPLKPDYSDRIAEELTGFFLEVIHKPHPGVQQLTAVSCLLQQSDAVRTSAEQNMSEVLRWILQQLTEVRNSISSDGIGKENLSNITVIVKAVLQLFQSCPSTTCFLVWKKNTEDETGQTLKQILLHLFQILNIETLTADVKMLSGTAIGIFLASAPTYDVSVGTFWTIFSNIFLGSKSHVSSYEEMMTEGEIEEHSMLQLRLGAIAMVKGILACASDSCLASHSKDSVPFCVELFSEVHEFCMGPLSLRYHAFNLLQTWFTKFLRLVSSEVVQSKDFIESCLRKKTLDIVWLNWDSPVDDVSELASESLKRLFEVWEVAHKDKDWKNTEDPDDFYSSIFLKLRSVPWYIKGQYRVMSALVPYVGSQYIITKYPELPQELLRCLSTNYLASTASDVYKTLVANQRSTTEKDSLMKTWDACWWSVLQSGCLSENVLQRNNINQYWIPSTAKISPELGFHIQDRLGQKLKDSGTPVERTWLLFAYLSLSKVIRGTHVNTLQNAELIREGLYSCHDEIRSEALGLVCMSQKKAEPLSKTEDALLREVLPLNLKVDSAPFRQHLAAHLKRLLTRVRDGAIGLLRAGDSGMLDVSVQFVEWLHALCINNLVPGACYQRHKTCLDLLSILYETFRYNEKARQRKSFTPESTKKLNQYVKEKGLWDFFGYQSNVALITCLLDGADDIQELACSLLLEYYAWPLDGSTGPSGDWSDGTLERHLLTEALRLCNSPKPYQCRSGALMCKLVFIKCVVENGWYFTLQSGQWTRASASATETRSPVHAFLHHMIQDIQRVLVQSQSAPVKASKSSPIHGYVTAVTRCLTECSELLQHSTITNLAQHYFDLVQLNTQIIQTMLNIMARGSESEGCPSFAEIGQALESLILENEEDYCQTETLSGEHQYLLSWCWVNIKESCISLGQLSHILISFAVAMATDIKVIRSVGDTFIKVLTQCRHRGVIEGCRAAFTVFCSALFESSLTDFASVPRTLLLESFDSLESKATSTSTTRKSAGLPVIIQSIVTCERRNKKNELMEISLGRLFNMAELPLETVIDERHDLPQVHALNILKCLYGDSSLHEVLMHYIGKAVILVVEQFGSPAWSIRNAATQLFSVLITRLFGQKKIVGAQVFNTKSLPELSAHYPELIPYLLQSLEIALQREITAIDALHPSLFPVLTILSNMGRLDQIDESSEAVPLRSFVKTLLRSPVYSLRHLSSAAFVALVPMEMTRETIKELISELTRSTDTNFIHGALVSIETLIKSCSEIPEGVTQSMLKIYDNVITAPDIVSAQYIKLMCCLANKEKKTARDEIIKLVTKSCSESHKEERKASKPLTEKAFVDCLQQHGCHLVTLEILTKEQVDADVKLYVIERFNSLVKEGRVPCTMPPDLLKCVQAESYPPLKSAMISCVTELYMKCRTLNQTDVQILKEIWQQNKNRVYDEGILASALLQLGCVYLDASFANEDMVTDDVLMICDAMYRVSIRSDCCKLAVCHGLLIIGKSVLNLCQQQKEPALVSSAIKMFFCVWNLVQDDDCDIRALATQFTASFSPEFYQYASLQCNTCLQEWINYFSGHFWWSTQVVKECLQKLYQPNSIREISVKSQQSKQLYEAEDNSFFSEAIFNSSYLFQMLQQMLVLSAANDVTHSLSRAEIQVDDLIQDLQFVREHLKICDTSVISGVCEPLYFRTAVELLLKVKLLIDEMPDCLNNEDLSQLSDGYINISTNLKTPVARF